MADNEDLRAAQTPMRDLLANVASELESGWRAHSDAPDHMAGHNWGDEVSREVGRIIREALSRYRAGGEAVAWPKRRANVPYQGSENQRLVGFLIERGDEAFGEYGISEPLAWLDRMCAAAIPAQTREAVLDDAFEEAAKVAARERDRLLEQVPRITSSVSPSRDADAQYMLNLANVADVITNAIRALKGNRT